MDHDKKMEEDRTAPSAFVADTLPPGTLIAGRFVIEGLAGRGGMGHVYLAQDNVRQQPVALKLLYSMPAPETVYRFNREASLLAALSHPGIVAHVAHGTSERGQPFLAMEWVEGEELAHRLARQALSLAETLALVRAVAEALAHAHRRGIVHRDLKPSNMLLRAGQPQAVVLLDFGLARHAVPSLLGMTGSHTVLGTPGYMAPEQASSQPEIPPAADIFSLGCVLYECLTGQPPFAAPHFAAALAKILFTEPAPLTTLRPGLPRGLQVLVDRMLAKEPQRRLADADALLAALDALPELLPPDAKVPPPISLTEGEQKLVSVLLLAPRTPRPDSAVEGGGGQGPALRDELRSLLAPHGSQVELLADGSLVATLMPEQRTATDLAALAARWALTFNDRWADFTVVLVTGLGVFDTKLPVGEAMERAGLLLRRMGNRPGTAQVVMDEVTAGLLGADFQLSRVDSGTFLLESEQLSADASRPLLGKPTPCVGREHELALLDISFTGCCEEPTARAVLVTAPAGAGKSRLRHEFLRRIERRPLPPVVLLGRGDPMESGAASYGLLGQALRRLCGIVEAEDLEARRARLVQRVGTYLSEDEAAEVVAFLGELCAIPFPDEHNPRLRAARGDPRLMSRHMGGALVAFLKAECEHHPVLCVLEDLHWSDALTVQLVDEVLRGLVEQPLLVLALARPEVKERFPHLWPRHLQEVPLHGLSRKASTRLAREVLGDEVPEALVQRAVDQSDGNALFLEELIRRIAEGRGESVPETILAVLQSRLMWMEPEARQVLLAASIFGRDFWAAGVKELLGWWDDEVLGKRLRWLEEQEIIHRQSSSRFAATEEYCFRHTLLRDAAHGLAPGGFRGGAHGLAAAWLERMGEVDALVLATHYQLGGQMEPAVRWFTRAAEQLFERNDFQGMQRCVDGALACGAHGEALSRLRALQAVAAFWREEIPRTRELGDAVLSELRPGSALWCRLTGNLLVANSEQGHLERAAHLSDLLLATTPEPGVVADYIEALVMLQALATHAGDRRRLDAVLARSLEIGSAAASHDVRARAWMRAGQSYFLHFFEDKPWQALVLTELAARDFQEFNPEGRLNAPLSLSGAALVALGDVPGALLRLEETRESARRAKQQRLVLFAEIYLMQALTRSTEPAHWRQARDLANEWRGSMDSRSQWFALAHLMMAQVARAEGELEQAETYARQACGLLVPFRADWLQAQALLSAVLLGRGLAPEARGAAEVGVRELERQRSEGVFAVAMYLALAEACLALEDGAAADVALGQALRCVRARARDIPDELPRERFLRQVTENARTLELVHQRWGGVPA